MELLSQREGASFSVGCITMWPLPINSMCYTPTPLPRRLCASVGGQCPACSGICASVTVRAGCVLGEWLCGACAVSANMHRTLPLRALPALVPPGTSVSSPISQARAPVVCRVAELTPDLPATPPPTWRDLMEAGGGGTELPSGRALGELYSRPQKAVLPHCAADPHGS